MDTYQKLSAQARTKRDAAIRKARNDYQKTIHAISALRRTLGGEMAAEKLLKGKSNRAKGAVVEALVRKLAPTGREFTVAELIELVGAVEKRWPIFDSSIRGVLRRLMDQGVLRKVRRDFQGEVYWERVGEGVDPAVPFAALSLPDAAAVILGEAGPLGIKELAVAIQARGCRQDAPPRQITESLVSALRQVPGRFTCGEDGRWANEGFR